MVNRVLVAEDGKRQCAELVEILTQFGCREVMTAHTAHEAIRIAMQARPETVIVDGLLPGMHGFEVARFIRGSDPAYRPRIIFVTAVYKNIRYQNEAKLTYGIDAYVIKPVTVQALASALLRTEAAA